MVREVTKRGLLIKDLLVKANPLALKLEENDININNILLYLRKE
jgi:hypothetical protein